MRSIFRFIGLALCLWGGGGPVYGQDLFEAVRHRNLPLVQQLVETGANVNQRDSAQQTPLHLLCARKTTADYWAFCNDASELAVAIYLISKGADLNATDSSGQTPLIRECALRSSQYFNAQLARLLIENGCDLNIKDSKNQTALEYAVLYCHDKILPYFSEKKADLNLTNRKGESLLIRLIKNIGLIDYYSFSDAEKTVLFLLKNKAYINLKDDRGKNALFYALYAYDLSLAQMLIEHGAMLDKEQCNNLLSYRFKLSPPDCIQRDFVELLVKAGGEFHTITDYPKGKKIIPVAYAYLQYSKSANINVLKLFIDNGADIHAKDSLNNSLLHLACKHDNIVIVQYLVEKGLDVNAKNKVKQTPLALAKRLQYPTIANYLRSKGAKD